MNANENINPNMQNPNEETFNEQPVVPENPVQPAPAEPAPEALEAMPPLPSQPTPLTPEETAPMAGEELPDALPPIDEAQPVSAPMMKVLMPHSTSSSVRRASVAAAQVRRFAPFISLHSVRMLFITPTRLSVTLTKQNRKSAVAHWICISLLIASVICRVPSRVSARCLSVAAA